MRKKIIHEILRDTQKGYDSIAHKFSQTRKYFWRDLEMSQDYVCKGDHVLDFGCGNGRLLEMLSDKQINYTGIDISQKLLDQAIETYQGHDREFIQIDPSFDSLPFPDDNFNGVFSIAVFHHIPSRSLRTKIAQELYRITKNEGYIVVSVWNLWQKRYRKNIYNNWKYKLQGKSILDWNDCYISFTDNTGKRFNRFHHAFREGEVKRLFEKIGWKTDKCFASNKGNIIYIGKKV